VRQCDSGTTDPIGGFAWELFNQLDALCHTNGTPRVAFDV
jgi:hypothetical protein